MEGLAYESRRQAELMEEGTGTKVEQIKMYAGIRAERLLEPDLYRCVQQDPAPPRNGLKPLLWVLRLRPPSMRNEPGL